MSQSCPRAAVPLRSLLSRLPDDEGLAAPEAAGLHGSSNCGSSLLSCVIAGKPLAINKVAAAGARHMTADLP